MAELPLRGVALDEEAVVVFLDSIPDEELVQPHRHVRRLNRGQSVWVTTAWTRS